MTLCAVCGTQNASHICRDCGRPTCARCFDAAQWRCVNCAAPVQAHVIGGASVAMWFLFIAFLLIFVGMLLMTLGSSWNTSGVSGGAIILIGPIPIILGSGPYSVPLIVLAAVLTFVALIVLVRRFR
jgi:uncharacterized membrane protein